MSHDIKYRNELNVFTTGYMPWKYPANWFRNVKLFFRQIKWAWQRATRGYCDWDVWDLEAFYLPLMRDSINKLAEVSHGYPATNDWTYDSWTAYLKTLADALNDCMADSAELNQYWSDFDKMLTNEQEYSDEEKATLRRCYYDRERQIADEQQDLLEHTFQKIAKHLKTMWD